MCIRTELDCSLSLQILETGTFEVLPQNNHTMCLLICCHISAHPVNNNGFLGYKVICCNLRD